MLRFKFLLVAVGLAALQVGCAQCDTCDDFPTPCFGGNCGPKGYAPVETVPPPPEGEGPSGVPTAAPVVAPVPPSGPSAFAPTTPAQPAPSTEAPESTAPSPTATPGPDLSPPVPPGVDEERKPNP